MAVSVAAINAVTAASSTAPIVMSFSDYDPVAAGFAASFAHPGGNITGIAMLATASMPNVWNFCMRRCRWSAASQF